MGGSSSCGGPPVPQRLSLGRAARTVAVADRSGRRGQRTLFALLLFGADPVGGVAELADLINNHRIDRRVINAYVGGALGSRGSARRDF